MDRLEQKICDIIDSKKEEIMAFGRDIWTHAEMGYREFRTSGKFAEVLKNLNIETTRAMPSPVLRATSRVKTIRVPPLPSWVNMMHCPSPTIPMPTPRPAHLTAAATMPRSPALWVLHWR